MVLHRLFVPGEFVTANEYIALERGNKFSAAKVKETETQRVYLSSLASEIEIKKYPVKVSFHWVRMDERTDPDNVRFAAKFILDGLVLAKILKDDSMKYIFAFGGDEYRVDKDAPGVEVVIQEMI